MTTDFDMEPLGSRIPSCSWFPGMIAIAYRTSRLELLRRFVRWVRERHELRFKDDDYGGDVTANIDEKLDYPFGAES